MSKVSEKKRIMGYKTFSQHSRQTRQNKDRVCRECKHFDNEVRSDSMYGRKTERMFCYIGEFAVRSTSGCDFFERKD
jgi:hypothetical protein